MTTPTHAPLPEDIATSRFLSLVLRHQPQVIGLSLGEGGWVEVATLLACLAAHGRPLTALALARMVATNDKQRFALSADGTRIRASQGHSVAVDLQLSAQVPPGPLFHGTARRFLDAIAQEGLMPQGRQHVHLSSTPEVARQVGARHGKPVVLTVDALAMHQAGFAFFLSANGVWLTGAVPARYLQQPPDQA
jgi:putative RNA 2'-phosphotransferase